MPRTVKDVKIGSREARSKLPARRKPYWRQIMPGLAIGYRRPVGRRGRPAGPGSWVSRAWVAGVYVEKVIAAADDFTGADGVGILDFAQAQDKVIAAARNRDPSVGPLTVAAALELHFAHLAGQGKSVVNQRYHADAHIIPAIGDMLVSELTTRRLQKLLADLAQAAPRVRTPSGKQQYRAIDTDDVEAVRRRRSSANRVWNTLRAALTHAWSEELVASDRTWRRVKSFRNVETARARALTIAESQRLINASDEEFRPLLIAALQTGCRYQELARAKVADFNPDASALAVWVSKSGKPRHVALTDEGVAFFRQLCAGRGGTELLLPRADGRPWGRSHQQQKMQAACKRAGIKPAVGIHCVRHTWASLAVMAGMSLMLVAKNLGHSDTKMVEKYYGHLAPSYIADEIRARAPRFGIKASNVTAIR